jgi:hypothetical protein
MEKTAGLRNKQAPDHWYRWSCDNWGTKWNSRFANISTDDPPGQLSFYMATAWSPPEPVFEKLVQLYPELTFEATGFDEMDYEAEEPIITGQRQPDAEIPMMESTMTTAKEISLDAMVREASRVAEQMFDKMGEVEMFWLIDTPAGMVGVISPVSDGPRGKDALLEKMREVMREQDATRYVRVTEGWAVKFALTSDHLADGEGTAFATNVPGSPIQVNGYRARGGNLFVYGVAEIRPDALNDEVIDREFVAEHGIEVVTGPEAEDLLRRVQADMGWRAKGSGKLADHPLRKEMISFDANDGHEVLVATRDVVRPPGGRPYLGELSEITRPDSMEGRMAADLLPSATAAARQ